MRGVVVHRHLSGSLAATQHRRIAKWEVTTHLRARECEEGHRRDGGVGVREGVVHRRGADAVPEPRIVGKVYPTQRCCV